MDTISCTLPSGAKIHSAGERRESPCRGDSVITIPVYVAKAEGATSKTWTAIATSILPEHRRLNVGHRAPGLSRRFAHNSTLLHTSVQVTAYESYVRLAERLTRPPRQVPKKRCDEHRG